MKNSDIILVIFLVLIVLLELNGLIVLNENYDKLSLNENMIYKNGVVNYADEELNNSSNIAVDNLDKTIFLTDVENYNLNNNEVKISESEAREIAQKGFNESKERIAGAGADNKETETVKIEAVSPNNYFTRYTYEGDKVYTNMKRNCYIISRENNMRNGISIYVDVTTGLIIGGKAYGD